MPFETKTSRRDFVRQTGHAAFGLAAVPLLLTNDALGQQSGVPASERLRIGMIGVRNQGTSNLNALLKIKEVTIAAVCDVDKDVAAKAKAAVEKAQGGTCPVYGDYRKLLENREIDAVVVTVPDHWHALITMDACEAGKDVYCEKPLTLTIGEGRRMVQHARKYKRIVQTGSQQRSDRNFHLACELVRNGRLGKIHTVRAGIAKTNFEGAAVPDSPPPPELDYDFWLGPAPKKPYNVKHVHYNFRFYWDYSGGQMTNWGAHNLDIAQWGLGMDESGPVSIEAEARFNKDGWYEVPEWCAVTYKYANGVTVLCGNDQKMGTTFEGEKGTIFVARGKIEASPPDLLTAPLEGDVTRLTVSANHHRNWLECIKSRKLPICDVEIGHRSASVCHLGNIAIRSKRKVTWNPINETIADDKEQSAMLLRPYRAPWHLPTA